MPFLTGLLQAIAFAMTIDVVATISGHGSPVIVL
jgi:hypothetical protein